MEKVRPWCGQPSDRGWLKNRIEHINQNANFIYCDVSISTRDLCQKKLFNSSSGSCHGSDVTWQQIGGTCQDTECKK